MSRRDEETSNTNACLLFDELLKLKRREAQFYASAQSGEYIYKWAMTPGYMRQCVSRFALALAAYDKEYGIAPTPVDEIRPEIAGDTIRWRLFSEGKCIGERAVTLEAGRKLKAFLDKAFPSAPDNCVSIRTAKKR